MSIQVNSIVKNAGSIVISGKCTAGATITITKGTTELGTVTASNSGDWTYTITDGNTKDIVLSVTGKAVPIPESMEIDLLTGNAVLRTNIAITII